MVKETEFIYLTIAARGVKASPEGQDKSTENTTGVRTVL